jgi:hypothetical protein
VVFYAGHVRKLGPTTEAWVGSDGRVVTDAEVAQHLRPLRAARTWVVVSGCYGGGFTEVLAPGRILTAAAPANALAYETSTYQRSYFGEYLVHRGMLEGLGGPTVQSAFAYAAAVLHRDHPGREPVEIDDAAAPFGLGDAPPPPLASAPPATTTTTTAPPPPPGGSQHCVLTAGPLVRCTSSEED